MQAERAVLPVGSTPPRVARPYPAPLCASPRLADLDRAAEDELWAEVAISGTPLVEDSGVPGETVLTFLWRGGAQEVLLLANKLTDRHDLASSRMARVPGTDTWHLSYRLPADWRGSYVVVVDGGDPQPDPWCRQVLAQEAGQTKSVAEGPSAPRQPFVRARPDVAAGVFEEGSLGSRRVWTWRAAGLSGAGAYPMLVLLDGEMWAQTLDVAATFDNSVAEGVVPPFVAVLVGSGPRQQRYSELTCTEAYSDLLAGEVLALGRSFGGSGRAVVAGQSLGGLAAAYAALRHPDAFRAALVQSGSFWWPSEPAQESEALTRWVREAAVLPERVWMEVGCDEWVGVGPSRRLRAALESRGVRVDYREFSGGHDRACWRGGLADGLVALLG